MFCENWKYSGIIIKVTPSRQQVFTLGLPNQSKFCFLGSPCSQHYLSRQLGLNVSPPLVVCDDNFHNE